MLRRRTAVFTITLLTSFGLAGCSSSAPVVSVHGGGSSVHAPAAGWCSDPTDQHCHTDRHRIPVLHVKAGTKLGVQVPDEVAKRAWVVLTDGKITGPVHHAVRSYKINAPVPPNASFLLQVQTLDSQGQQIRVTGDWVFRIRSN